MHSISLNQIRSDLNRANLYTGIILLCLLICSCDPPHSIHFENNGNSELNVLFVFDTTASHHDFYNFKDEIEDTLNIKIQPGERDSIYFGIGTWTNHEIRIQAKSLQSFTLENDDFKTQ